MKKGHIVFLNGVTSSGKTSIAKAIQERDDTFFYIVSNDMFQNMISVKLLKNAIWSVKLGNNLNKYNITCNHV